MVLQKLSSN